jgi:hypothetical protein
MFSATLLRCLQPDFILFIRGNTGAEVAMGTATKLQLAAESTHLLLIIN